MGLQQLNPGWRIIFLKSFAKEILTNLLKEENINKEIELEKLRQEFIEPIGNEEAVLRKIQPIVFPTPSDRLIRKHPEKIWQENKVEIPKRPVIYRDYQRVIPNQKQILPQVISQIPAKIPFQISPEQQPKPQGFVLGRLEPFLNDKSIQSIECPGPGKNILIKRYSKVNITKTILSQLEIADIINKFSIQARVPAVGGILKVAVGDLVISAIISEFVGSRFIINKITPYSLIE